MSGLTVEVKAAPETVSPVYCEDSHLLTRAVYHLGNRHVPLQVEVAGFVINTIMFWMKWPASARDSDYRKQPFEPEGGAYGGRSGGHHHHH